MRSLLSPRERREKQRAHESAMRGESAMESDMSVNPIMALNRHLLDAAAIIGEKFLTDLAKDNTAEEVNYILEEKLKLFEALIAKQEALLDRAEALARLQNSGIIVIK